MNSRELARRAWLSAVIANLHVEKNQLLADLAKVERELKEAQAELENVDRRRRSKS
jgi:hypothetical protein